MIVSFGLDKRTSKIRNELRFVLKFEPYNAVCAARAKKAIRNFNVDTNQLTIPCDTHLKLQFRMRNVKMR